MPDPDWQPIDGPPKSPFIRKLGTYLFGVAIGFGLLGWFQYKKSVAARQQYQQTQGDAPEQTPPDDASPSAPEVESSEPTP